VAVCASRYPIRCSDWTFGHGQVYHQKSTYIWVCRTTLVLDTVRLHKVVRTSDELVQAAAITVVRRVSCALVWLSTAPLHNLRCEATPVSLASEDGLEAWSVRSEHGRTNQRVRTRSTQSLVVGASRSATSRRSRQPPAFGALLTRTNGALVRTK
jgi:hypothetical protein